MIAVVRSCTHIDDKNLHLTFPDEWSFRLLCGLSIFFRYRFFSSTRNLHTNYLLFPEVLALTIVRLPTNYIQSVIKYRLSSKMIRLAQINTALIALKSVLFNLMNWLLPSNSSLLSFIQVSINNLFLHLVSTFVRSLFSFELILVQEWKYIQIEYACPRF